ncbi:MAG: sigma-70 family RNA polymerase sigma factor [bacterium]|nr:sigma-70 family RNA polymerase sigma factor [bacterium]
MAEDRREPERDLLHSGDAADWDRLIEAVGPASLLVVIRSSMSRRLMRDYAPEDVLQESLLYAWRDREKCEWQGVGAFRRWLLRVITNRIHDLVDRVSAQKRGAGKAPLEFSALQSPGASTMGASQWAGPAVTTTPSRAAMATEQADQMSKALAGLPEELRGVVHLRLFEDLTMQEVADRVGIGVSAAAHRFRKGASLYQGLLSRAHGGEPRE